MPKRASYSSNFSNFTGVPDKIHSVSVNGRAWGIKKSCTANTSNTQQNLKNPTNGKPLKNNNYSSLFFLNTNFETRNDNVSVIYTGEKICIYTKSKFCYLYWTVDKSMKNQFSINSKISLENLNSSHKTIRIQVFSKKQDGKLRKDYIEYKLTQMNRDLDETSLNDYCLALKKHLDSLEQCTSVFDTSVGSTESKPEKNEVTIDIDIINKKISVETEIDHYISYEKVNRIKEEVPEIKVVKENTRVLLYFSTSATLKWSRQDWQKEFNWIAKKASDLSEVIEKFD